MNKWLQYQEHGCLSYYSTNIHFRSACYLATWLVFSYGVWAETINGLLHPSRGLQHSHTFSPTFILCSHPLTWELNSPVGIGLQPGYLNEKNTWIRFRLNRNLAEPRIWPPAPEMQGEQEILLVFVSLRDGEVVVHCCCRQSWLVIPGDTERYRYIPRARGNPA